MALQALGVSQNDEVLVQAMTCNAVVTPILCIGAKPVYVDISKSTFNIDVKDLKKKYPPDLKSYSATHIWQICRD